MKDATTENQAMNSEPTAPEEAYVAPAIVWEQVYVALQQISEPPCIPGMDPRCTP